MEVCYCRLEVGGMPSNVWACVTVGGPTKVKAMCLVVYKVLIGFCGLCCMHIVFSKTEAVWQVRLIALYRQFQPVRQVIKRCSARQLS